MAKLQTASPAGSLNADPLRWLWRLLTSVRFALGLIGFLALAALVGILIPQLPFQMRGNPPAIEAWLAFQETRFGVFTDGMYRLGLFDVFRTPWFGSALALLVVSVCVCTFNRLPPVWRNVREPQARLPDEYLEASDQAIAVAVADPGAVIAELKRRHYKVTATRETSATYVFADRFAWAQLATFVSHLALILFLAGGLVTLLTARDVQVFVAEADDGGAPVFALSDKDHMQLYVEDAIGRFDATGFPLDFRSLLSVHKDGQEVARGVTTVNRPLRYGGYNFHQSAYFPDGAALQVREVSSGRLVYSETLALTSSAATPQISVRDATGRLVLDESIVPTDFIGEAAGTTVVLPGLGRQFWIGARGPAGGWQLIVFETSGASGVQQIIDPGATADLGAGLSLTFTGLTPVPSTTVASLPGASGPVVTELSGAAGERRLTVGPVAGRALVLVTGQPVRLGDYEYVFAGEREFAGITVRRDPGSRLIWLATGTFLLGLGLTFYTPRRRLWGKITAGQAHFRGLGGRNLAIERELREVARKAGA